MNATELLGELHERGVELRLRGDRLIVEATPGVITPGLLAGLRREKPQLVEVLWRLESMRRHLPEHGPLPLLVARDAEGGAGGCISCGDPISADNPGRCGFCVAAAGWLLRERLCSGSGAEEGR